MSAGQRSSNDVTLFSKSELGSKSKVTERIRPHLGTIEHSFGPYSAQEILGHAVAQIRVETVTGRFQILELARVRGRDKYALSTARLEGWIRGRLVRDSVAFSYDETELLKLVLFSIAMPYKMMDGQSVATTTELVRRTKRRDFLQIVSDQFIGRIGEVAFKRFAEERFKLRIGLDWKIGTDITKFESDLVGSSKRVDIKSTDTAESIWAVAPAGADYGILVKVCIPHDFFLKLLAHISSLSKFIAFMRDHLESDDDADASDLVDHIESKAFADKFLAKAFVCGFFRTGDFSPTVAGVILPYLGEVAEDKFFVPFNTLSHEEEDWNRFFADCKLA